VTLDQFFNDVYLPIRLRGRSPRTVTLYRRSIAAYSQWLGRHAELSDLDDTTVCRYLLSLECRLGPYTIAKERSQLLAIWNCAARRRYVDRFPDVPSTPLPRRIPVAWSEGELARLLSACSRERGAYCGVPAGQWWVALHLVIWDTGERIGALLPARWDWIRDDWLIVPAESRKGRRADAAYRLAPGTLAAVDLIREPCRSLVWPWPYCPSYLWHVYGLILSAAHLPCDRKRKFHCVRKSVASHLKRLGQDPQLVLGHADPRTTAAYLDPRIVAPRQPCDVLPRIHAGQLPGEPIMPPEV
jgi:integrase